MDFKKLVIISGVSVIVIISTYFATKVDKQDTVKENTKAVVANNTMAEDDTEVEVKKDIKVQTTQAIVAKQDEVQEEVKIQKVQKVEEIASHEEAIKYIETHSLKNISNPTNTKKTGDAPRFTVYSNVTVQDAQTLKNQFTPPPAPAIVSGVFPSGEPFAVVIDGDVKATAKEIVVSNNQADGVITEMAQVSTTEKSQEENQNNALIAPPSVGQ